MLLSYRPFIKVVIYLCNLVMQSQWMESAELRIIVGLFRTRSLILFMPWPFPLHHALHHGCYAHHFYSFDGGLLGCIVLDEKLQCAEFAVEVLCKGPKNLQPPNSIFFSYFTRIVRQRCSIDHIFLFNLHLANHTCSANLRHTSKIDDADQIPDCELVRSLAQLGLSQSPAE